MEKIYRVQMNSKGMPNFSTAEEVPNGKWEEKETFSVADDDPIIERWQSAKCSMCERYHTTPYMYYFNDYNYCPYCGSRMKGADDERL